MPPAVRLIAHDIPRTIPPEVWANDISTPSIAAALTSLAVETPLESITITPQSYPSKATVDKLGQEMWNAIMDIPDELPAGMAANDPDYQLWLAYKEAMAEPSPPPEPATKLALPPRRPGLVTNPAWNHLTDTYTKATIYDWRATQTIV